MRNAYFLIPMSFSPGGLPVQYWLTDHLVDRRTRFLRFHEHKEVDKDVVVYEAAQTGMEVVRNMFGTPYQFRAPDGITAGDFFARMTSHGWRLNK